ncbi:MAG: LysM peptidoglycan-binding domain-containing protein [bacterium]|nr:LysM peptidoglycan-binding domain-containing protein [bacterium]
MRRHVTTLIALASLISFTACSHVKTSDSSTRSGVPDRSVLGPILDEGAGGSDVQERGEQEEKSVDALTDQQRINDALDFYQDSQYAWDNSLVDDAITALDQSYRLILEIDSDQDPDIVRQKEDLRLLISKRVLEIYASRSKTSHLGGNEAIPLILNQYVEREIKSFQGQERRFFVESYRRSGRYRDHISGELDKAGLPSEILWLPLIESGYKDRAFSRARALGLWQFIASTGYKFNLKRDQWIDERMDFEKSTQGAIAYLTALHDLFGDWTTALAAYNCGEGNVLRAIREQRVNYMDNFWDLYPFLPRETARYVPRLLAVLHIVSNPHEYGFTELTLDPPIEYEEVTMNKQVKLSDISSTVGISLQELEALNPALRQKVTPDYPYTLRVPPRTGSIIEAGLKDIPATRMVVKSYTTHRVRRGETLSHIARKYRTSISKIARINNIRRSSTIRVGQRLKVPLRRPVASFNAASSAGSRAAASVGDLLTYRVRSGDTLWSIARKYNTSVKRIKRVNNLSTNHLRAGQILQIPVST